MKIMRLMSILLTFLLALSTLFTTNISYAATTKGFEIEDGILIKYTGTSKTVNIPASVKTICNKAFYKNENVISITGGKNVADIGYEAFFGCSKLKKFAFSGKLKHLGDRSFFNCKKLQAVTLPKSLEYLGNEAFYGCDSIQSIRIPDKIASVGESTFFHCSGLKKVILPNKMVTINRDAFSFCTQLEKITLPGKLEIIEGGAFLHCKSLPGIVLPDTLVTLGRAAFAGCTSLEKINIPEKVKLQQDSDRFLEGCKNLKEVTFEGKPTAIPVSAFKGCSSLTSITIPDSVTSIGSEAFKNAGNLETVIFNGELNQIGDKAFDGTKWLLNKTDDTVMFNNILIFYRGKGSKIIIPENVKSICSEAFMNNKSITDIKIPDNVKTIGDSAFQGCSNLGRIELSEGIQQIGKLAFGGCNLKEVTLPESVKSIGDNAFRDCKELKTVNFSNKQVDYGVGIFDYTKFLAEMTDDFLIAGDGTLLKYIGSNKEITIPDNVTAINHYAFGNGWSSFSEKLHFTKITVPGTVKDIRSEAFQGCFPETIILEDGVTTIGDRAFLIGQESILKNITIPSSVVSIGENAFDEDDGYSTSPTITCKNGSVAYKTALTLRVKINTIE